MDGVLEGIWRKASDEQYKVFVSGSEKKTGEIVEVLARFGGITYTVITGTHSKIKGGYLYDFRYTGKPKPNVKPVFNVNLPDIDFSHVNNVEGASNEVTLEELDDALGLD